MAYNSAYTGPQVDAAVGAVQGKETTWDGKQDKLVGQPGQVVGFDAEGNAIAQTPPETGDVKADGSVPMTGDLNMGGHRVTNVGAPTQPTDAVRQSDLKAVSDEVDGIIAGTTAITLPVADETKLGGVKIGEGVEVAEDGTISVTPGLTQEQADKRYLQLTGGTLTGALTLNGEPTEDLQAAPKQYVDALKPLVRTITLTTSGWSSNTKTVGVPGVAPSETAQLITPVPNITSQSAYYEAGIMCTNQGRNSLTFTCQTVPTSDLTVYVVIQPLG